MDCLRFSPLKSVRLILQNHMLLTSNDAFISSHSLAHRHRCAQRELERSPDIYNPPNFYLYQCCHSCVMLNFVEPPPEIASLDTLYTVCILTTAMLTVCAFDKDVWYRDIDSSPSPFPMSILLYFVFPCLSRWSPSPITPVEMEEDDTHPAVLCLPGCGCTTKPQMTQMTRTPTMTPALLNIHDSVSTLQSSTPQRLGNSASLSRSLVRIPNATERRESIVIAFEV